MARLSHFVTQGDASSRIVRGAESLLEGLRVHPAPSDPTGALRDRIGTTVSKKDGAGAVRRHDKEVESVLDSLENLMPSFIKVVWASLRASSVRSYPEYKSSERASRTTGVDMMDRTEMIRRGSDDYDGLAKAILQAAREGDERAVDVISAHLDHEDYMVRGAAIRALLYYLERGEFFDQAVRMT